jgi:hypothetical protein
MTDLFAALDKAAEAMLEKAMSSDNVNLDKAVSVFQTVAKYAEQRAKMEPVKPAKPERSKIDDLRDKFRGVGETPKGRATRRSASPALSVVEATGAGAEGDD